jgi:hypothetical protein
MDLGTAATGIGLLKTAIDTARAAFVAVRDVRAWLPWKRRQQEAAVREAIDNAERALRLAEAQIAQELQYELCRCQFPPTPMLEVGHLDLPGLTGDRRPVYRCPACGKDNSAGHPYAAIDRPRTVVVPRD